MVLPLLRLAQEALIGTRARLERVRELLRAKAR